MNYEVSGLVRDIRIALDNNMNSEPLELTGDIDTLALNEIIESKIPEAARIVTTNAPQLMLDSGKAFGTSVGWKSRVGYGAGFVALPDDFLRLVTFQMSDWSRAVNVAIAEENPLYAQQTSRYPGIKGNPQKPVVAIVQQPIGLVLEFFSCTQGANVYVKRARYIPIPKIVDGKIDICEKLKPAVIYYAAHIVANTTLSADLSASLLNTSNELLK